MIDRDKLIEALSLTKEGKASENLRVGYDYSQNQNKKQYDYILFFTSEEYKEEFKYCIDKKFISIVPYDLIIYLTEEGKIELRNLLIESI